MTATAVVTVVAVVAVSYGFAGWEDPVIDEFGLVAVAATLIIGVPALFMWFNTVRVLRGDPSAAWRVHKHVGVVTIGMLVVGAETLLFTAQFAALGFLAGAFVVVMACARALKRVLVRERVGPPPPNWHDRQLARAADRRR